MTRVAVALSTALIVAVLGTRLYLRAEPPPAPGHEVSADSASLPVSSSAARVPPSLEPGETPSPEPGETPAAEPTDPVLLSTPPATEETPLASQERGSRELPTAAPAPAPSETPHSGVAERPVAADASRTAVTAETLDPDPPSVAVTTGTRPLEDPSSEPPGGLHVGNAVDVDAFADAAAQAAAPELEASDDSESELDGELEADRVARSPILIARPQLNSEPLPRVQDSPLGPSGSLDGRQMLFGPGESASRAEPTAEERRAAEQREREDRKRRIYGRLRRVMELGRTPR